MIVQRCLYLVVLGFLVSRTRCQPAHTPVAGAACWPVANCRSGHAPTTGRARQLAALAVQYLTFAPWLLHRRSRHAAARLPMRVEGGMCFPVCNACVICPPCSSTQ